MTDKEQVNARSHVSWFVGAFYSGTDDQTQRFLAEGVWENGYRDRYHDLVRSMRPGDRIAIKSSYVRKNNLPFDSRGLPVSVMAVTLRRVRVRSQETRLPPVDGLSAGSLIPDVEAMCG